MHSHFCSSGSKGVSVWAEIIFLSAPDKMSNKCSTFITLAFSWIVWSLLFMTRPGKGKAGKSQWTSFGEDVIQSACIK